MLFQNVPGWEPVAVIEYKSMTKVNITPGLLSSGQQNRREAPYLDPGRHLGWGEEAEA